MFDIALPPVLARGFIPFPRAEAVQSSLTAATWPAGRLIVTDPAPRSLPRIPALTALRCHVRQDHSSERPESNPTVRVSVLHPLCASKRSVPGDPKITTGDVRNVGEIVQEGA